MCPGEANCAWDGMHPGYALTDHISEQHSFHRPILTGG